MQTKHKNLFKSGLISSAAIALTLGLTGCQFLKPSGPYAQLNVHSAEFLNPNIHNEASPVVLTIYQLKSPFQFKQATYQALAENSAKVLGSNLIDENVIEIRPNSNKSVSQTLSPNTQYLGIVAAYRQVNQSQWKSVVKVANTKGKATQVNIDLESEALTTSVKQPKASILDDVKKHL